MPITFRMKIKSIKVDRKADDRIPKAWRYLKRQISRKEQEVTA